MCRIQQSAISSSRPSSDPHSFPISPKALDSPQIPSRGADIGGMWTSGVDGFGAAAPARIVALGSAMGSAAMTVVIAERLPKVIRRPVYYGSELSCQVPINPNLF